MKPSNAVIGLVGLIVVLALVAVGAGLLWSTGGDQFVFTSIHGEEVKMYGQGLYRHDNVFTGAGSKGTDVVTLVLALPLLVFATAIYRRGSPRGSLMLLSVLAYILYVYASRALSNAYNEIFLVYVALFSAAFYAFVVLFASIDPAALPYAAASDRLRRGLAVFMFACGVLTSYVWLEPLVSALVQTQPPYLLDSYATMVTDTLDLGIIVPATFLSGVLVLRRRPLGYLIAFPLLGLLVLLGPMIAAQTFMQIEAGVSFTGGEIVGPISGFLVTGVIAVWILFVLLRDAAPHLRDTISSSSVDDGST